MGTVVQHKKCVRERNEKNDIFVQILSKCLSIKKILGLVGMIFHNKFFKISLEKAISYIVHPIFTSVAIFSLSEIFGDGFSNIAKNF